MTGELRIGGQEQFYLESQAAIAYPAERDQLVVHASTQNPTEVQAVVAEVLGLGQHQVVCLCKRMGGAFGGKESQSTIPALMAALVTWKTNRPARVIYHKDDDMRVTGKRHAYLARWEVGFDDGGRIEALRCEFYSNGGAATDLSPAILERTLFHADNAYYLPHVELTGRICFTNLPPNTAFRGFGGPQAMVTIENILETIAQHLGLDALEVRRRNLYGVEERNTTPYGQVVEKNHLPEILEQLATQSHYQLAPPTSGPTECRLENRVGRARTDDDEIWYRVYLQVHEPGQRLGECLHRWHRADLQWGDRDGAGSLRETATNGGGCVCHYDRPGRGHAHLDRKKQ